MSGKVYDNFLARLAVADYADSDEELFIADSVLKRLSRWQKRSLNRAVNRVRETTAFELYRVDEPDRQGYLLQVPPAGRSKTKRVKSIEIERRDLWAK